MEVPVGSLLAAMPFRAGRGQGLFLFPGVAAAWDAVPPPLGQPTLLDETALGLHWLPQLLCRSTGILEAPLCSLPSLSLCSLSPCLCSERCPCSAILHRGTVALLVVVHQCRVDDAFTLP